MKKVLETDDGLVTNYTVTIDIDGNKVSLPCNSVSITIRDLAGKNIGHFSANDGSTEFEPPYKDIAESLDASMREDDTKD